MEDTNKYLQCVCGCGIVNFERYKDEVEDTVLISYYPLGFYAYQKVWKEKIKAIWYILTGKYYRLFDIIAPYEDFKKLAEELDKKEY